MQAYKPQPASPTLIESFPRPFPYFRAIALCAALLIAIGVTVAYSLGAS